MKILKISAVEEAFGNYLQIYKGEYPLIELDHEVTTEEFNKAIDTIISYFAQNGIMYSIVRLQEREDSYVKKINDKDKK